jgi:flagellin-like protein
MRKLFRNRRAVSPVVSTVLMILVVIIGMSVLFDFFVNYTRDFQTGSGSAVLESMVIEDVWYTGSNGAQVWVYNVGKVSLTINSVYVNDQKTGFAPSSLEVAPGQHENITIASAFSGCTIKIVTARGSAFEGRYS